MTTLIDSTTEFDGQVALITGGGSGIGQSIASRWAARRAQINRIAPGPADQARSQVLPSVPARRFAMPEEIAQSNGYLLSSNASYITGELLVADGGQWLGKANHTDPGQARR